MAMMKVGYWAVLIGLILVASSVPRGGEAALTCGQVSGKVLPCLNYLKNGGPAPPPNCCNGIRDLNNAAKTTADRQTACRCLKSTAGSVPGLNYGLAAALPGKCGVNVPYKIGPSTDCARVRF